MPKFKKVTETKQIEDLVPSYDSVLAKELIAKLQSYIEKYGEGVSIMAEAVGYDGGDEFHISFERDETPVEQAERLEAARKKREDKARMKKESARADREQYEKLKKRFG